MKTSTFVEGKHERKTILRIVSDFVGRHMNRAAALDRVKSHSPVFSSIPPAPKVGKNFWAERINRHNGPVIPA